MRPLLHCTIALLLLAACGDGGAATCEQDADCASGFCRADRTCAPDDGGGATPDADPSAPDGGAASCVPDHDGTVIAGELPLVPGRTATFRVALDAPVDTAGDLVEGGAHHWDFAGALEGDDDVTLALGDPTGAWWQDEFPSATYAARLSVDSDLLGLFATGDDLLLVGVVSPEAGIYRTELTYDPPVAVLDLPLEPGAEWETNATVSGLAEGGTVYYGERYESRADAVGTADTPYGDFPVVRVATDLTRNFGGPVVTLRSFAFVSECYGTVVTISSHEYDDGAELDEAAELWRLAP
jgi:hypothetical protein